MHPSRDSELKHPATDFILETSILNIMTIEPTRDDLIELLRRVPDAVGWAYACWDTSGGISEIDEFVERVEVALKSAGVSPIPLDEHTGD